MAGQMNGPKVYTLKVNTKNQAERVEAPAPMDPLTEQVRLFSAQVTALLADVEIELEAAIARELSGVDPMDGERDENKRRMRPRRFQHAA